MTGTASRSTGHIGGKHEPLTRERVRTASEHYATKCTMDHSKSREQINRSLPKSPMEIYVDLDNTLCHTDGSDYLNSNPIPDRVARVNALRERGHKVTIWTARGSKSGKDWKDLTVKQLAEWGVQYDKLLMGKPHYDLCIDDKSENVNLYWKTPGGGESRKTDSHIVKKGWGEEIWFVNNDEYCGKILRFDMGRRFSMHYHLDKKESWYIAKGSFISSWIDTEKGITHSEILRVGDSVTNERGAPHQMEALEPSEIFEVSTPHKDSDSYRVYKGD